MAVMVTLAGSIVRLEPLTLEHVPALVEAAAEDPALYAYTIVPQGKEETERYVQYALDDPAAVPFATVRMADERVVGTTRFAFVDRWEWPPGHERHGRTHPDVCEIGYTWLARSALRTGINREAKRLMLTFAFEEWGVLRVALRTDRRNERSRTAIERLGATFDGILRAERLAVDVTPRDSAFYSITADEWPRIKPLL